jgi:hypothetical protein
VTAAVPVAKATPDGYTAVLALNPALRKELPYRRRAVRSGCPYLITRALPAGSGEGEGGSAFVCVRRPGQSGGPVHEQPPQAPAELAHVR